MATKLYWRQVLNLWHAFEKDDDLFRSLCGQVGLKKTRGSKINRPPVDQRCPLCNSVETERSGKQMPKAKDWKRYG